MNSFRYVGHSNGVWVEHGWKWDYNSSISPVNRNSDRIRKLVYLLLIPCFTLNISQEHILSDTNLQACRYQCT